MREGTRQIRSRDKRRFYGFSIGIRVHRARLYQRIGNEEDGKDAFCKKDRAQL